MSLVHHAKPPSACSIARTTIDGFEAVQLDSGPVQVDILPELGGKIWNVHHRPTGRQWIWHNPRVALRKVSFGESYDDHWPGGWEELFPNDAPGLFGGRDLPDHGEWWCQPWQWEITEHSRRQATIRLWVNGSVTRTLCEKTVSLVAGASRLELKYRITNLDAVPLHCLFKEHLAVALSPGDRIELPGGRVTRVDPMFSTLVGGERPFEWPYAESENGERVDLSVAPPQEARHREFVYVSELPAGWCGVEDAGSGARLRMHFQREVFPYVWLFMTFGGWRGLYTVVLEPCTNMPKDLNTAYREGRCAVLAPGATLECAVQVEFS